MIIIIDLKKCKFWLSKACNPKTGSMFLNNMSVFEGDALTTELVTARE